MKKILSISIIAGVVSSALMAEGNVRDFLIGRDISPARGIVQPPLREQDRPTEPTNNGQFRAIDGRGNNLQNLEMGATFVPLVRLSSADYTDGLSELAGQDRLSPRVISNTVAAQSEDLPNPLGASDFLWQWGQFIDHDIDLTDGVDPAEPANISVPLDDEHFFPGSEIPLNRSIYDKDSGISDARQQLNEITAWIDGSNVYGSDSERANALRTLDGTGRLKTSEGNLLPFNEDGLPNAGGESPTLFLAGDVRANEQIGLTAMHTLFMREHNRLVTQMAQIHPDWDGEKLYQEARQQVASIIQVITYKEFLPALLGKDAIRPYSGYKPQVNAGIVNMFSAAAYRFGHSALSPQILRLDANGEEVIDGHLPLRNAFFSPQLLDQEDAIDPILRGLAGQSCQTIDTKVVDDVRNFLFGAPGAGGFDLASLNIQRGRDHGLPSYNDAREALGLPPLNSFSQVTSDESLADQLALVYSSPNEMDLWVGGLAEDALPGSHVGQLITQILRKQFESLRDGDRFWYERVLKREALDRVRRTRLSDVIRRNTQIGNELQANVFLVANDATPPREPAPRARPPRR